MKQESNKSSKQDSLITAIALLVFSTYVFGLGLVWVFQMVEVDMVIGGVIASQVAMALFAISLLKFKHLDIIAQFKVKITMANFLLATSLAITFLLISTVMNFMMSHFGLAEDVVHSADAILDYRGIVALFIGPVVLSPIFEELAFRVGLKRLLVDEGKWKPYQYVIISAALFASTHWLPGSLNIFPMLLTFAMGIVFGIVYLKKNNLLIIILSHMIYNLAIIIVSLMV